MHAFWHWLMQHMGIGPSTDPLVVVWYAFWSGIGSDFGQYTIAITLVAGMAHTLHRNTCHVGGMWPHGCWWPAVHDVEIDGVKHRVCHRHGGHPTLHHHPERGLHHADLS